MTKIKRPRPDELTEPDTYGDPVADAIHHALVPLDRMVTDLEQKWGPSRLIEWASPELAARFGQAKAKLDAAVGKSDVADVAKRVGVLMRGYKALADYAQAQGHRPMPPDTMSITSAQGSPYVFARDNNDAYLFAQRNSHVRVYCLDELANLLDAHEAARMVNAVKKHFPEARMTSVTAKPVVDWKTGDDMPF